MSQPNILFIQVDQLSERFLRAYGDRVTKTPNLDWLAESGTVFETAYCNYPLCAPSRASMAAGQLCSKIEAFDNAAELPAAIPTYAHYLRHLGYQTAVSGKLHFVGPDQHHGFERRLTADLYPADFSWVPNWGAEGKRDTNDPRTVQVSGICERSVQIDFDEEVTFKAIQHLYDVVRSNDKRPFFLQVSYTHPHDPYLCQKEFWDLYRDDEIPEPVVPPIAEDKLDAHLRRLLVDHRMLNVPFAKDVIHRARHAYYGSISYIDSLIGKVLQALRATGADKNTAIVFTADHGEMLGERGMWFKKHLFDSALRVPLIIKMPGQKPKRVSEFVSLVDLLPTFSGMAMGGGWSSTVEELDGADLTPLVDSKPSDASRPVYAEYLAEAALAPIFMIRRGAYKYIASELDPPLLFDLERDPHELVNRAGDPAIAEIERKFEQEVRLKWDSKELTKRITLSQRRRRLILDAQRKGRPLRWNHGEAPDQEVIWYRGNGDYNAWSLNHLPRQS